MKQIFNIEKCVFHDVFYQRSYVYTPESQHGGPQNDALEKVTPLEMSIFGIYVRFLGCNWLVGVPAKCHLLFHQGWVHSSDIFTRTTGWLSQKRKGGTWRIIPLSKQLVTPSYKPFRPFGRGTTPQYFGHNCGSPKSLYFICFFPKQFTVGVLNATLDLAALVLVGVAAFLGSEVLLAPFGSLHVRCKRKTSSKPSSKCLTKPHVSIWICLNCLGSTLG